jgi:biotin synthase
MTSTDLEATKTSPTYSREEAAAIYRRPLLELVFDAARVHREHHESYEVQCSSLLNIKSGSCPEDCGYCSQSAHNNTSLESEPLMELDSVLKAATNAKANGADRFCMGAAWRGVADNKDFDRVLNMVSGVKALGLETCATLGLMNVEQAHKLKEAGLDYYNHNLDTSREYYDKVITTRSYDDRLDTLAAVRESGMKMCCGGILGMGESEDDRINLLHELHGLEPAPESVPINALVAIEGTPLEDAPPISWDQMLRSVATARILMPTSKVRLSAGRTAMSEESQTLCFLAGANSIFLGDKLLTTNNVTVDDDSALFAKLGLKPIAEPCEKTFTV